MYPNFAQVLPGLMDNRQLDVRSLAQLTDLPEPELAAVLRGTAPRPELLRLLAPALGLHTADLFLIAWVPLPDDLLPCDDHCAQTAMRNLVRQAMSLPADGRSRLRELARSLPSETPENPPRPLPAYEQYQPSAGALLLRLLRTRNLNWAGTTRVMYEMGGLYLAASTVGGVGRGVTELTVELATSLGRVLDISEADLAVLTGITIPAGTRTPAAVDTAGLLWEIRRLTVDQVFRLCEEAKTLDR